MDYAKKKALRQLIKNLDKKYLGGFIQRKYRNTENKKDQTSSEEIEISRQEIIKQVSLPLPSDRELKRVEIIILKYKDPEVELKCVQHIIENTEWPYKLVFFDNRPGTKNMSKIWNKLIQESTCDYVALMDSDAFVPKLEPCWLTRCMRTFEKYPECMVVSPKLTRIGMAQQRATMATNKPPEKIIDEFANTCMIFKKEIFDKIGYYDEEFLFYGSDSEWAARFIHFGMTGYLRPDIIVHHEHHYSAKKASAKQEFNRKAESDFAIELYKQKIQSYQTNDES